MSSKANHMKRSHRSEKYKRALFGTSMRRRYKPTRMSHKERQGILAHVLSKIMRRTPSMDAGIK